MNDPYYTLDTTLFDGQFRYFGSELVQVRGKVHQSEERYSLQKAETDIEPIQTLRGSRTYIHMKPFVLVPDITLTIGVYPQPVPTGALGEVLEAHEPKHREERLGSPADHPLVPSVRFQKTVRDFGWNACAAAWSSLHYTLPTLR
jgi:hypothetical protein